MSLLALLAVSGAGCGLLREVRPQARPFITYEVTLKDESLKVIGVTGRLFNYTGGKVTLKPLLPPGGGGLQPIDLEATALDGRSLRFERRGEDFVVDTKGKDFSFSYDLVLTVEDRYSPDIRTMLTFLEHDR
jgi:hypothetical protein